MVTNCWKRNWAGMTSAPVALANGSRNAACHEAVFDGVNRHDFFQRLKYRTPIWC